MKIILGIDAAWTHAEPSGVALIELDENKECRSLATAPSYDSFVGLAEGTRIDWNQPRFAGSTPDVGILLAAAEKLARKPVDILAVDIPVATIPITKRREADQKISQEFGGRWCSAHTPSLTRPGRLGATLSSELHSAGYPLLTGGLNEPVGKGLLEVYPHPALLSLLNRSQRVPYKVSKSNRYWPRETVSNRIGNLLAEFEAIYAALAISIDNLPFHLPKPEQVAAIANLKRYEDALDSLVCAWVGAQFLLGRTVALGDATAAIWCPQNVVGQS